MIPKYSVRTKAILISILVHLCCFVGNINAEKLPCDEENSQLEEDPR